MRLRGSRGGCGVEGGGCEVAIVLYHWMVELYLERKRLFLEVVLMQDSPFNAPWDQG